MSDEERYRVIRQAYVEGFCMGQDHDRVPCRYPPLAIAWLISGARILLAKKPLTEDQQAWITQWEETIYDDRPNFAVPQLKEIDPL